MIRILLLIIFATSSFITFSQDLIVRDQGDSINCKITKVKKENIYFTFKHKDEIRSTLLPVSQIKTYKIDFYTHSEVPKDKIVGYKNYEHFRIAVNGGYSYQIARVAKSVPADFKDYIKGLKSGYHWGGDITYYFSEPLGIGFKYYQFHASNSIDNLYVDDLNGNRRYGRMSDDLKITFIGPMFSTRILNGDKSKALIMNLAMGYMGYQSDKVIIDPFKMTGSTLGMTYDFGYDISLSKNLMLGFQVSLISGTLSKYDWNDGKTTQTFKLETGEYESLHRIDLSVGLRFK